jgi:hypothetical protein
MIDTLPVRIDAVENEPLHHFHPGTRVLRANRMPADLGTLLGAAIREGACSVAVPAGLAQMHELASVAGLQGVCIVSSCVACELPRLFSTLRWVDALVVQLSSLDAAGAAAAFAEIARLDCEDVWVELHCSVLPEPGDDRAIDALTRGLVDALGPEIPLHVRPLRDDESSREQARHARWIAAANGLHWVYGGDPLDERSMSSWCPGCDGLLADRRERAGAPLLDGTCPSCAWPVPGRFLHHARRQSSHTMRRVVPSLAPLMKRTAT